MQNTNDAMLEMAGNLWERFFKYKVRDMLGATLRFYRAQVVSAAADGKIAVREPFEPVHELPYVGSAADLQAGQQCIVLVLGDAINSIVIGDGTLSNL